MWDTAYLINLPERTDRLNYALWELGNINISPIVVPGTVLKNRELACKLTHLDILKTVLRKNIEKEKHGLPTGNTLIIEDDLWVQNILDISKQDSVTDKLIHLKKQSVNEFWKIVRDYETMLNLIDKETEGWDLFFFYCDKRFVTNSLYISKAENDSNISHWGSHIVVRQSLDNSLHLLRVPHIALIFM